MLYANIFDVFEAQRSQGLNSTVCLYINLTLKLNSPDAQNKLKTNHWNPTKMVENDICGTSPTQGVCPSEDLCQVLLGHEGQGLDVFLRLQIPNFTEYQLSVPPTTQKDQSVFIYKNRHFSHVQSRSSSEGLVLEYQPPP